MQIPPSNCVEWPHLEQGDRSAPRLENLWRGPPRHRRLQDLQLPAPKFGSTFSWQTCPEIRVHRVARACDLPPMRLLGVFLGHK